MCNNCLNKQQFGGATATPVTKGTDTKGEGYTLPAHVGSEAHNKVTGSKHMEFGKKK